ncbi:MAG: metal ABC transporter ATP-binding protein [Elusimicrobiota bacterium]|jgi:zinc transport system ATP-binding protein|nr:metal ABC transporter ATP-binding protein [Elusimicrobiota bacterium]
MNGFIKFQNVSFEYNSVKVVENLTFEICRGDYFCIFGENGSGKSTVIKGLLKLKQTFEGQITFSDDFKRNEIGYVPQIAGQLQKDFPASVFEIVMSGFLNKRKLFYSKNDKTVANENLKILKAQNLKNKPFNELSSGQKQRIILARALCAAEKTLVLDEPTTGLDPSATSDLYQCLKFLNKEKKLTIIMISHDINRVLQDADKILHLQKKQLFFGSAKDYFNSQTAKVFNFYNKEANYGTI